MKMNESLKGIEQTYRRAIQSADVLDKYDYEQLLREDYLMRIHEFREEGRAEEIREAYVFGGVSREYAISRLQHLNLPTPADELLNRWDREKEQNEQNGRSEQ